GSAANAQDPPPEISRAELLKRVDRKILLGKHHIDSSALAQMQLRVLLSIDELSSSSPQPGETISVSYTVTNFTLQEADGIVTGQCQGSDLVNLDGSTPSNVHLPPGKSLTSALKTRSGVLVGTQPLRLAYRDRITCHELPGPRSGKPTTVCTAAVTADA